MARRADHVRRRAFFKVLLPCCLQNLSVPGEIAGVSADGGDGDGAVLVVGALGRVWPVQVRRERDDGGGGEKAVLARGWAEFARAHGVGAGWFVVFRHEGRGLLSVKVFDPSLCRREFCTPCPDLTGKNVVPRPRFIRILFPEFSRRMPIPPRFVRNHMMQDDARPEAMIFSPLRKFWRVGLERDRSCIYFGSGWAEFLTVHGLSEGHLLLFRYEGNMVFTVKAFEPSGYQKEFYGAGFSGDRPQAEKKQLTISTSRKSKCAGASTSQTGEKKPESSPASANKRKAHPKPVHLTTKIITARALNHNFTIGRGQCASVGLPTSCTVTLKTSVQSKRSWKATLRTANTYCYLQSGWKEFCRDNNIREGDQCTINIVKRSKWHVIIRSSRNTKCF